MQQIISTESYAVKHIHKLSDNVKSIDIKKHADQNKLFRTGKTPLHSRDRTSR